MVVVVKVMTMLLGLFSDVVISLLNIISPQSSGRNDTIRIIS